MRTREIVTAVQAGIAALFDQGARIAVLEQRIEGLEYRLDRREQREEIVQPTPAPVPDPADVPAPEPLGIEGARL